MTTRTHSVSNLSTRRQDVDRKQNGAYRVYAAMMQVLVFRALLKWAWEELNFRPHAYQAHPKKYVESYVRKIQALTRARLFHNSSEKCVIGRGKRRQRVDSESVLAVAA